jgi:SAM-dependent methyltransferase
VAAAPDPSGGPDLIAPDRMDDVEQALDEVRSNWDALGRDNPLWAIRSDRAEWDLDEFFASGRVEVDKVLAELADLGIRPYGVALDFGSGAGRLTQALATVFDAAVGVDVARSMVALAEGYNRQGDRCRFVLNEAADLSCFADGSFDFVYSHIVLQHVGTDLARRYIAEFLRVVAPGGIVYFQVPSQLIALEPLPPEGYRARITELGPAAVGPRPAVAGTPVPLRLAVENTGTSTWSEDRRVRLGLQWFAAGAVDGDDRKVVDDGQRVRLDSAIAPGETVTVGCALDVPHRAGAFTVEVDLLQENVAWFKDHGSTPLRLDVVVAPAPGDGCGEVPVGGVDAAADGDGGTGDAAAGDAPLIPRMEMHPVPREEVLAIVERHGGETLAVLADSAAGPDWVSHRYVIRRRDPAVTPGGDPVPSGGPADG